MPSQAMVAAMRVKCEANGKRRSPVEHNNAQNAIYDAIGVRIKDLPITPEKILKALEEKGQ